MTEQKKFTAKDGRDYKGEEARVLHMLKEIQPEKLTLRENRKYTRDSAGWAQLFHDLYSWKCRYCLEQRAWYIYNGNVWKVVTDGVTAEGIVLEMYNLLCIYCGEIEAVETREQYHKYVKKLGDRPLRMSILNDARNKCEISVSDFDKNTSLVNMLNGTFDMIANILRPHNPEDYITKITSFAYDPADKPKCDRWERFIDEVTEGDKDKAGFLQRALGYSISGAPLEECMFILYGSTTRNGKTTLLNTIQHVMGDYADTAPVEMICKSGRGRDENAASPALAKLKGKRFVTMSESGDRGRFDEERIKNITGRDTITCRELYSGQFNYSPQFTMWLATNYLPEVKDTTLFTSRRIYAIEFNKHFSATEQDVKLKDLFTSQTAMAGIFDWLYTGYVEYKYARTLNAPPSVIDATNQYKEDSDDVLTFLEERYERADTTERISSKGLYLAYTMWAKSARLEVMSGKKFQPSVKAHSDKFEAYRKINGTFYYTGIKAKSII